MAKKTYDLKAFVDRKIEEDGLDIEIEGETFTIPPLELWGSETWKAARESDEAGARALLGDRYEDFVALGGNVEYFSAIVSDAFFSKSESSENSED